MSTTCHVFTSYRRQILCWAWKRYKSEIRNFTYAYESYLCLSQRERELRMFDKTEFENHTVRSFAFYSTTEMANWSGCVKYVAQRAKCEIQTKLSSNRILAQTLNRRYYSQKGLKTWNRCNWLIIGLCYGPMRTRLWTLCFTTRDGCPVQLKKYQLATYDPVTCNPRRVVFCVTASRRLLVGQNCSKFGHFSPEDRSRMLSWGAGTNYTLCLL